MNTARQLGFAFGIAALGSVFTARAASVLADRGVAGAVARAAIAGGRSAVLLHQARCCRRSANSSIHAAAVAGVQGTLAGWRGRLFAGLLVLYLVRRPADRPEAAMTSQAAAGTH